MTTVRPGDRTFVTALNDFGTVTYTSFLGLSMAPVITTDDGTKIGIAGQNAMEQIVPTATGENLLGDPVAVPIDVKMVGIQQLTEAGIAPDVQAAMFSNWRANFTAAQRAVYTEQWSSVIAQGSAADQALFVEGMVALLSSPPPS